jgi:hypothetical protein
MKIAMYDLEGHLLEVLEGNSYAEIFDLLPIKSGIKNTSSIQKVVRGERNYADIFQFREVFNDAPLQKIGSCVNLRSTQEKSVQKYYKGTYICTYRNIQEASTINNIEQSNISRCIRGERATAGSFGWKFVN